MFVCVSMLSGYKPMGCCLDWLFQKEFNACTDEYFIASRYCVRSC